MIWFVAKDSIYFQDGGRELIKKNLIKMKLHVDDNILDNIIQVFTKDDASKMLKAGYLTKHVLSPIEPEEIGGFFTIVELPNLYGTITSTQHMLGIKAQDVLKEETGMNVSKSSFKFSDMAGARKIKRVYSKSLE